MLDIIVEAYILHKNIYLFYFMMIPFTFIVLMRPHGKEQLNCLWKLPLMVRILVMKCLASLLQLKTIWIHFQWQYRILLGYLPSSVSSSLITVINCNRYYFLILSQRKFSHHAFDLKDFCSFKNMTVWFLVVQYMSYFTWYI